VEEASVALRGNPDRGASPTGTRRPSLHAPIGIREGRASNHQAAVAISCGLPARGLRGMTMLPAVPKKWGSAVLAVATLACSRAEPRAAWTISATGPSASPSTQQPLPSAGLLPESPRESGAPTVASSASEAASGRSAHTMRVTPRGKGTGAACVITSECRPGLACCQTGFRGHCGGAVMPDTNAAPCVFSSTCAPAPCTPMALPP
jgi:hypothetical protein